MAEVITYRDSKFVQHADEASTGASRILNKVSTSLDVNVDDLLDMECRCGQNSEICIIYKIKTWLYIMNAASYACKLASMFNFSIHSVGCLAS